MKVIIMALCYISFFCFRIYSQTVIDYDGNVYPTVTLGNQTWMAENLKTTHYNDGDSMTDGTGLGLIEYDDPLIWNDSTKRYFYYNDNQNYKEQYGILYSWYAAVRGTTGSTLNPSGIQGVCPSGWHIPSLAEWEELESFLGDSPVDKLLPGGTSGFNALLAGVGGFETPFQQMNETASFIVADPGDDGGDMITAIFFSPADTDIGHGWHTKTCGYSVRCVADEEIMAISDQSETQFHFTIYPNPFNPSTTIRFTLTTSQHIFLKIYDLTGQQVVTLVNEVRSAGEHQVLWQAVGLPGGIYIARLQAGGQMKTMKLVLHK